MNNLELDKKSQHIGLTIQQYSSYLEQLKDLSHEEYFRVSMMLQVNEHEILDLDMNAKELNMPIELYREFLNDFIVQSKEEKKSLPNIKNLAQNLLLDSFVVIIEEIESTTNKEDRKKLRKKYFKKLKGLHVENN